MSINGFSSTFLPYTLSGLTTASFSNSNIGTGVATTLQVTTATPSKIARFDANQQLVSASVDTTDLVPYVGALYDLNLNTNGISAGTINGLQFILSGAAPTTARVGSYDTTGFNYLTTPATYLTNLTSDPQTQLNGKGTLTGNNTWTGTNSFTNTVSMTPATATATFTLGLNGSNQIVKYTPSGIGGSVSATYIPYASSANTLANSNISQTAIGDIFVNGFMGVGASVPLATLHVQGLGLVCGGTNYANTQGYMALGSLTLGATNKNYGGGSSWSANTAGLLMECLDNTEIAVHDAGFTVASLMYYAGNQFTIGRNMGFGGGASPVNFASRVQITGTTGSLIRIGNAPDGSIYWANPNGTNSHWGYPSGGGSDNYIRGTQTYIDTPTQMSAGLSVSSGIIECANQSFCIVGCVGGASVGYGVGQVIGSLGYMFAYSSASMTNSGTSGWNSSFGRFYFTKTGRWQVNWSFYWNNFAAGSRVQINRLNSGLVYQESRYCALNGGGIGSDTTQAYSTLFYAYAGDILECTFSTGSGTLYFGGITHTHCTYHFLG